MNFSQQDLNSYRNQQFLKAHEEANKPSYELVTDFSEKSNNNKMPVFNTPFTKGNQKTKDWILNSPIMKKAFSQLLDTLALNPGIKNISQNTAYNPNDKRVNIKTNLKDELINKLTEDIFFNRYKEVNPRLDITAKLGSQRNWQADFGFNLGKNKGINFNIGRKF